MLNAKADMHIFANTLEFIDVFLSYKAKDYTDNHAYFCGFASLYFLVLVEIELFHANFLVPMDPHLPVVIH